MAALGSRHEIKGWIRARDGKRQEYWDAAAPNPAFFVPQAALCPGLPEVPRQ